MFSSPLHNLFRGVSLGKHLPHTHRDMGRFQEMDRPPPSPPRVLCHSEEVMLRWGTAPGAQRPHPLPVDGRGIPHVKAGGADPLQKRLGQFRCDVINRVQLLGGVVIADKQPNLVEEARKISRGCKSPVKPRPGGLGCAPPPDTRRCPFLIFTDCFFFL